MPEERRCWRIKEEKLVSNLLDRLPIQVLKKYEFWKEIIYEEGPMGLRRRKGFHDESLEGERRGERSSRLNIKWRVIYRIDKNVVTVYVEDVTPHKY